MAEPPSLILQQQQVRSLKQMQCAMMSPHMQQAMRILEAPVMELSSLIESEMENNPILELHEDLSPEEELDFIATSPSDLTSLEHLDENFYHYFLDHDPCTLSFSMTDNTHPSFLENSLAKTPSLFEYLMLQAQEIFEMPLDLTVAELIIGSLNDDGWLTTPLEEISTLGNCDLEKTEVILAVIQTFYPSGIAARSLQECILIQLKMKNQQETIAYHIVDKYFDHLIHHKLTTIRNALGQSATFIHSPQNSIHEIKSALKIILSLDFHPGTQFSTVILPIALPDATLHLDEDQMLKISINEEPLPRLRLNEQYLRMLTQTETDEATKEFVQGKINSAVWLFRNLTERHQTLFRVSESLAKRQKDFFLNPQGQLTPLTMQSLAEELELNESTIARVISNKYIDTPRGLFPLRFFFTSWLLSDQGEKISANTAKDLIKEYIKNEDPQHPLSDEIITQQLREQGIHCARRTVAKYRQKMGLASCRHRHHGL